MSQTETLLKARKVVLQCATTQRDPDECVMMMNCSMSRGGKVQ